MKSKDQTSNKTELSYNDKIDILVHKFVNDRLNMAFKSQRKAEKTFKESHIFGLRTSV